MPYRSIEQSGCKIESLIWDHEFRCMPFSVSISESRANDYSQKEKDFGFMTYSNSCHAFH